MQLPEILHLSFLNPKLYSGAMTDLDGRPVASGHAIVKAVVTFDRSSFAYVDFTDEHGTSVRYELAHNGNFSFASDLRLFADEAAERDPASPWPISA